MKNAKSFYRYARERQSILLARRAGKGRPWTKDPVLQSFRFCNIFREDDKTTVWFRENVRERYHNSPAVLLATVVFRMFNRIETGEAVFCQPHLDGPTAFETLLHATQSDTRRKQKVDAALRNMIADIITFCGRGPYVTGAYIISSPPGRTKLLGMIEVIRRFVLAEKEFPGGGGADWLGAAELMLSGSSLQDAHNWFSQHDYFGKFHSYEIVTDLRHTPLLSRAPDVMTWANPGPGCKRGMNRVMGRDKRDRVPVETVLAEMAELLTLSERYWPSDWPSWEMRDVEHTLCEFDKYERVRLGEGRPRSVYR